ncbi:protein of unknown function [Cohaesibacter sp. ES.047]|nr:protein of unknown function [Cohaesibacter sp. ES.047]
MPDLADIEDNRARSHRLSLALSVMLHGLLFGALISLAPEILPDADEEETEPIKVDFIPLSLLQPSPPDPPRAPSPSPRPAQAPRTSAPPETPARQAPSGSTLRYDAPRPMVRASRMMAASLLDDPANAEGRKEFYGLTEDEQQDQLCALEALEQIRAWNSRYVPERMVSYTFKEVRYEGNRIIADGAAFWSKENWHRLKFDCLLSDDHKSVVDFSFLVGVIVPKDQWEEHNLTRYK